MDNVTGRTTLLVILLAACSRDEVAATEPYYLPFPCAASGTVTRTGLSLESPELKPWLERVSGHHEAALGWEHLYLTDRVGGFDERTTLSMDVVVHGAEDYSFVPDANAECGAATQRSMDVEIQLATGDGAFGGSIRHSLLFHPAEDGLPRMETNQGFPVELERFSGTFELGMDPLLVADPESVGILQVFFSFQENGIQGSLHPQLFALNGGSWAPVEAAFPYTCAEGDALDRPWPELGGTPRAAYEAFVRRWPTEPMLARYVAPDDFPRNDRPLAETQLTASAGPLARICQSPDRGVSFFGPLLLETSDGRVRFEQEMETIVDGSVYESLAESPYARAFEFERALGIQGVEFGATHGRVHFRQEFSVDYVEMFAGLRISTTDRDDPRKAGPALTWCAGRPSCGRDPSR